MPPLRGTGIYIVKTQSYLLNNLRLLALSFFAAGFLTACGGGGGGGGSDDSSGGDGGGAGGGTGGSPSQGWNALIGTAGAQTYGEHVALDPSGNVFIAGTTDGDLDGSFGSGWHTYLAKYNAEGSLAFQVQTQTTSMSIIANGLATDRDGNAYVVSSVWVDDNERHRPTLKKFSPQGALLGEWDLGSDGAVVSIEALAVDAEGNIIVGGYAYDSDAGVYPGTAPYLIAKYDPEGNLLWRRLYNGVQDGIDWWAHVYDIAVDGYGNIYVTGRTRGSLHGQTQTGGDQYSDAFLVKFDPNGNIIYARQFGGYASNTQGKGIAVDGSGRIFIAGDITGTISGETRYGHTDYFLAHFDTNGNLQNVEQLGAPGGGSTSTHGESVATDAEGNVYVVGSTTGSIDGVPEVSVVDSFISKYDPSFYRVSTQQFGVENGGGYFSDVTSDESGKVYISGLVAGGDYEGKTITGESDALLSQHNGDWTQKTSDSGSGSDGGSGSGDGSTTTLDWKENWKFVQGDKAVQYRLALVRVDGSHHIFRIQYRVNSEDSIWVNYGYHLYRLDDNNFSYRVEFPQGFHGTTAIYMLPSEIAVYVDGTNVEWDSSTNELIYHNSAYLPSGYSSCVDDNSADSRCEGYYQWDRSAVNTEYTASDNY